MCLVRQRKVVHREMTNQMHKENYTNLKIQGFKEKRDIRVIMFWRLESDGLVVISFADLRETRLKAETRKAKQHQISSTEELTVFGPSETRVKRGAATRRRIRWKYIKKHNPCAPSLLILVNCPLHTPTRGLFSAEDKIMAPWTEEQQAQLRAWVLYSSREEKNYHYKGWRIRKPAALCQLHKFWRKMISNKYLPHCDG